MRFCGIVLLPTVPGDRLLDLAELLLHAGINFVTELTAGGGEQLQQHDVLDKVIYNAAGWHPYRRHVEMCRHPAWTSSPSSPKDATVPAAPPSKA